MLNIVKYKGCKRCGGDLFLERDSEGSYVFCLQCSASYVQRLAPPIKKPISKKIYARLKEITYASSISPPALLSRSLSQRLTSSRAGGEI